MTRPLFFIVWGTKVRICEKGVLADFCPDCHCLSRFQVKVIEKANHVYYIGNDFKAVEWYGECSTCGTKIHVPQNATIEEQEEGKKLGIEDLVNRNSRLSLEHLLRIRKSLGQEFSPEERDLQAMTAFSNHAKPCFEEVETNLGGWVGIILILFIIITGLTFSLANVTIGISVSMILFVIFLVIRYKLIQRGVARIVRPRLQNLLSLPSLDWGKIDSAFTNREIKFRRLWRHLQSSIYDDFRWDKPLMNDSVRSNMDLDQYLATQTDLIEVEQKKETQSSVRERSHFASGEIIDKNPIRICGNCHLKVCAKSDGTCPSCQTQIV